MLFSDLLKYQYKDFSRESLLEPDSLKIIQEAFAKAFAYYYEPNHQNSLKIYAESMFNYMDSFNKQEIHIALEEMKHSMNLHNITRSMWDLKNTEKFSSRAIEHIFEGEINSKGQAVGFHTEILTINNTRGSIIPGTEQDFNEYGVYKAKVKINGIPKRKTTDFPPFSLKTGILKEL
ncbi:EndoU domain-containing protein (plasmid) [Bacillus shihchuchen]|uniref:EndoU domain-containing protein n=1 Tax=Bacillus shihchuchen TaxID=3036942 RepID=A0ABT7KZ39_9BACI|nr:EndoU domain-containing protein [Bacillus shihchuchen]